MKRKYMIVITSGLGNQMGQYALFIYLKSINSNPTIYLWKKHLNEHNGFELTTIFGNIKLKSLNSELIQCYIDFTSFCKRVQKKLNNKLLNYWVDILGLLFPKVVVFPQWDNYLFVNTIRATLIHETFVFSDFTDTQNVTLREKIVFSNSVSIHIRRGDTIKNPRWRCSHGDICDADYYTKAIDYIKTQIENPYFVVFSDDIAWVKSNLALENMVFVDWNNGKESFRDMQLMTLCKHNIIANSTFSWWGAVLNRNIKKIVVAPVKWINTIEQKHAKKFNFSDWVIIDNNHPNVSCIIQDKITNKILGYILRQTYEDFEVLLLKNSNLKYEDKRIKELSVNKSLGSHQFVIEHEELGLFRDKHYLSRKLLQYFRFLNEKEGI